MYRMCVTLHPMPPSDKIIISTNLSKLRTLRAEKHVWARAGTYHDWKAPGMHVERRKAGHSYAKVDTLQ